MVACFLWLPAFPREFGDMVQKAPSEDSFYAPDKTRKKRALEPFPYGIGIDCHSRFIQVCVRTSMAAELRRSRM